ncbi:MAG: response regulator, partial [Deltaproteobacteria bacterium]|nr:response regulator [Deltaproteobacteria bacterium]
TVEEAMAMSPWDLLTPESRQQVRAALGEEMLLEKDGATPKFKSRVEEVQQYHKDGSLRWVEMTMTRLPDRKGEAVGFLGISRDITYRKRVEEELQRTVSEATRLREEAERPNRAKSEFLANMSHELRTPMNAIIGFSEILEDQVFGSLNETQLKYVKLVLSSGYHLLQLINDILDLAKVEAGKMPLRLTRVNIAHLLESSLEMIRGKASKRGLALRLQVGEELQGAEINADGVKLQQVLFNLLSNAVKFTDDGGTIQLTARRQGEELVLAVSDTGIGLKSSDLERVFGAFEQVDSSLARKEQGTGLGLALCRRLVEMHGGKIWAESPGEKEGSTFAFSIPIMELARVASGDSDDSALKSRFSTGLQDGHPDAASPTLPLVLVVEDDPVASELMAQCLRDAGYAVAQAFDGEQAVEMARQLRPFAITLDIVMPKKGGFDTLIELKALSETKDIPVFIVATSEGEDLAMALGAVDFLPKPLDGKRLLEDLAELAGRQAGRTPRVLIVDDDPSVAELISAMLTPGGYDVLSAYSGQQGVDVALSQAPDIVVLDLIMPGMDGFQVLETLRAHDTTAEMPIVLYTNRDLSPEDLHRLETRVQGVVPKSLGKERLLAHLDHLRGSTLGG